MQKVDVKPLHAHYRGHMSSPLSPYWAGIEAFLEAVDGRLWEWVMAPCYDSLAYQQYAWERLQSCRSNHAPRPSVIITLPSRPLRLVARR